MENDTKEFQKNYQDIPTTTDLFFLLSNWHHVNLCCTAIFKAQFLRLLMIIVYKICDERPIQSKHAPYTEKNV